MVSVARAKALAAAASAAALALALVGCVEGDLPPPPAPPTDGNGVVTLASSSGCGEIHLVVSNGTVYWTEADAGEVKSVRSTGGTVTRIATGQAQAGALAVDSASIFWVAGMGRKAIMKKPLMHGNATVFLPPGTAPETFHTENTVNALLVDSSTLFVGRFVFALKMPTSGGEPTVLMESPDTDRGRPAAFALDPTHLYQTELMHPAVSREKLDGSQMGKDENQAMGSFFPDRIATSQDHLLTDAIAVVDNQVYWATAASINSKPADAAEHSLVSLVTSTVEGKYVTGFVIAGDDIYFGEEGTTGAIERASLSDGVASVIATGQPLAKQFAADDQNVYWATADCRIVKRPK
jgi:hypothetical protein